MKIGELSRRTGVSVRMLRYYEAEGVLTPDRTAAGYREYSPSDVDVIERIRLLGNAGMTLAVIRDFLPCRLDHSYAFEPCDDLKAKLRIQIKAIDEQSRGLERSKDLLIELLQAFEASTSAPSNPKDDAVRTGAAHQ